MSHYHERKEKICLNCGAALFGRYCHTCGQENIEPKETFIGLVTHFFYDITHFDGNFFSTVKFLLTKPGYLSKEFIRGRRASYLHPIRMYVFTSAIFFIIFFAMFHVGDSHEIDNSLTTDSSSTKLARTREAVLARATSKEDSVQLTRLLDMLGNDAVNIEVDSTKKIPAGRTAINLTKRGIASKRAYDSAQQQLPEGQRDRWLKKMITLKLIEINQKLQKDPRGFFYEWIGRFVHLFPQLLFVSLPAFAFILQLLYVRHRKYYYADHGIFTIHLYIFTFISLLIYFSFAKLQDMLGWQWLNFIKVFVWLYILWYAYKAMRNFYGQGRFKTFVKYCLLSLASLIVILFLFVIFFMLSFFQI